LRALPTLLVKNACLKCIPVTNDARQRLQSAIRSYMIEPQKKADLHAKAKRHQISRNTLTRGIWRIKNNAYLSNDMLGLGALLKLFIEQS
jgi:hypothetical protein